MRIFPELSARVVVIMSEGDEKGHGLAFVR